MGYLSGYLDLAITVKSDDSAAAITDAEVARLQRLLAVATFAAQMPRRLGGDATPEELAADKKRAKRIAHAVARLLKDWGGETISYDEAGKHAAVINWESWWADHQLWLRARQRYIATWCHRYGDENGDIRWCKSAMVRLENELKWIEHALR